MENVVLWEVVRTSAKNKKNNKMKSPYFFVTLFSFFGLPSSCVAISVWVGPLFRTTELGWQAMWHLFSRFCSRNRYSLYCFRAQFGAKTIVGPADFSVWLFTVEVRATVERCWWQTKDFLFKSKRESRVRVTAPCQRRRKDRLAAKATQRIRHVPWNLKSGT